MNRNEVKRCARRLARTIVVAVVGVATIGMFNGAALKHKPKRNDAWFRAHGAFTFPLAEAKWPLTHEQLVVAMTKGWQRTPIKLAPDVAPVTIAGGADEFASVRVDLSHAQVEPGRKSAKLSKRAPIERSLHVNDLQFLAQAFSIRGAALNMMMTAANARLDLQRDRAGNPLLNLGDLDDGKLEFSMPIDHIEALLVETARADAGKLGLRVEDVDLVLATDGPRTVYGQMDVQTKLGFIGAGLHFAARINIDDGMNAKITDLHCWGDDVLGPIVVGIIRPALAKYNNRTRPIVKFPSDDVHLRDLSMKIDDTLRITASFGKQH